MRKKKNLKSSPTETPPVLDMDPTRNNGQQALDPTTNDELRLAFWEKLKQKIKIHNEE
jgi:hypothetical protein